MSVQTLQAMTQPLEVMTPRFEPKTRPFAGAWHLLEGGSVLPCFQVFRAFRGSKSIDHGTHRRKGNSPLCRRSSISVPFVVGCVQEVVSEFISHVPGPAHPRPRPDMQHPSTAFRRSRAHAPPTLHGPPPTAHRPLSASPYLPVSLSGSPSSASQLIPIGPDDFALWVELLFQPFPTLQVRTAAQIEKAQGA